MLYNRVPPGHIKMQRARRLGQDADFRQPPLTSATATVGQRLMACRVELTNLLCFFHPQAVTLHRSVSLLSGKSASSASRVDAPL